MADSQADTGGEVTRLLRDYADGDKQSLDAVVPIVYRELKSIAHAQLQRSGVRSRVQTTMLVHEAYEKLMHGQNQQLNDRRHFFAVASRAMRQIVVDNYRAEVTAKRGGGVVPEPLITNVLVDLDAPDSVLNFEQAVQRLTSENPELAELVDLACFGGLSTEEIAELTETSVRTVQRKLARAEAWIVTFLEDPDA